MAKSRKKVKAVKSSRQPWPQRALALAKDFHEAVRQEGVWGWKAAMIAVAMRAAFPTRANKGGRGWSEFCRAVLRRHPDTVATYIRAARYCETSEVDGWPDNLEGLPPWYLVSELAGRQSCPERDALHQQLFAGAYHSPTEFRKALSQLAEIEEARDPQPSKRKRGKKGEPRGRGKGAPSMQTIPRDKLCSSILPKKLPERNRVMEIAGWMDITDLTNRLTSRLTANERTVAQMGAMILISPMSEGGRK